MDQNTIIIVGAFVFSTLSVAILLFLGTRQAMEERREYQYLRAQKEDKKTIFTSIHDEHAPSLEYLKNISYENIKSLRLYEINNILDLKKKIVTERDIENYSEMLGIHKKIVEDWVQLGEFTRLLGVNRNHVSLFEKVGIRSVEDLSKQDSSPLLTLLLKNQDNPNSVPTIGMLEYWIRNSKKIINQ